MNMLKYLVYCTVICVNALGNQHKIFNAEYVHPRSNEEDLFNLKYPANNIDLAAILESMVIYRTMLSSGGTNQLPSRTEDSNPKHKVSIGKSFCRRTVNLDDKETGTEEASDNYPRDSFNSYISKLRRQRATDEEENRDNDSEEEEEVRKKNYYMLFSRRPAQLKSLKDIKYEISLKNRQN